MPESIPTALVVPVVTAMGTVIAYQEWRNRTLQEKLEGFLERCLLGMQNLASAVEKVADRVRP